MLTSHRDLRCGVNVGTLVRAILRMRAGISLKFTGDFLAEIHPAPKMHLLKIFSFLSCVLLAFYFSMVAISSYGRVDFLEILECIFDMISSNKL